MSNGILKLPLSLAAHIGILAVPIPYNATTFATTELEFPCKADSDADVERRNVTIIEIGELLSVAEMRKAFPTNIPAKVYRVTRKSEFDGQIDTVVMKVAYNDMDVETLEREAGFYCNHLKCLQGRDVPTFYGLYALGPVIPRSPSIAIMVLEDGGDSLEVPLCEQPLQFRLAVHQSLARIHHHGQIRHGDFAERNIVVRINQDGTESDFKAMIIDFERAEGHLCKAPETIALPITESPEFGDYCCRELHIVAEEACLWEPSFSFFCDWIPQSWAVTPKYLEEKAGHLIPSDTMSQKKKGVEWILEDLCRKREKWLEERKRYDALPVRIKETPLFFEGVRV